MYLARDKKNDHIPLFFIRFYIIQLHYKGKKYIKKVGIAGVKRKQRIH